MKTDQVLCKIDQEIIFGRQVKLEAAEAKLVRDRMENLEMLVGHLLMTVRLAGISVELPPVKTAI